MAVLVIAEHDNKTLKRATLQAVDAATRLGEVHLLVLGSGVDAVAQAAAKVAGVAQVKVVDDPALAEPLAEVVTAQVVPLAKDYSHVVAAATAHGKDFMPRVAALLDVAQISEVTGIDSADTFRRPIYAGNAIATVQSSDPIKVLTVRGTAFGEAAAEAESEETGGASQQPGESWLEGGFLFSQSGRILTGKGAVRCRCRAAVSGSLCR